MMLYFWAIAPVMNGIRALPQVPSPPIHPTAPVRIHGGRMRAARFIAIGNMGPSNRPMMDAVMAFPIREGTNQITNSSLRIISVSLRVARGEERKSDLPQ